MGVHQGKVWLHRVKKYQRSEPTQLLTTSLNHLDEESGVLCQIYRGNENEKCVGEHEGEQSLETLSRGERLRSKMHCCACTAAMVMRSSSNPVKIGWNIK